MPPPLKYVPHIVKKIKGFPLKVKSFRNTATYQKLQGGVTSTPPCTRVGVWIWVYVRGLKDHKFVLSMHFKNYSKIESTRHLKPKKDSPPAMLSQYFFLKELPCISRFVSVCQYVHQGFMWEKGHVLMFSFQSRGFEQTIQTTPTSALVILTEIIIFC